MFKIILSIIILGLSFSSTTWAQPESDWVTFAYGNFEIQHPNNWTTSVGKAGTEFMLYAPLDDNDDLFLEVVALRIMEAAGELDEQVVDFQVYLLSYGYEVLSNERMKKNELDYHFMEYQGLQGEQELYHLQYQWVINGEDVQLSFLGKAEQKDKYRELALQIMDTFQEKE